MKANEIKEEFEKMKGLKLSYQNQVMLIKKVSLVRDKIALSTTIKTYVLYVSEAIKMLEEIDIVGEAVAGEFSVLDKTAPVAGVMQNYKNNADKVTDALMMQMEIITSSSNVVQAQLDKAKAMSQIANTLVNVEKVKLEYLNLMNK